MDHDVLYNEFDPFAASWLENLIARGLIAPGIVDRRSIVELEPEYVARFRQVHFFAGIGTWSHAGRGAGLRDDAAFWTFSCPCQPFSGAGLGEGFDDPRHLWPHVFRLMRHCRPEAFFAEQVASKDGLAWLDLVLSDSEGEDYAIVAQDRCAAGVGAPHIRQRQFIFGVDARRLVDGQREGLEGFRRYVDDRYQSGWLGADAPGSAASASELGGMADFDSDRLQGSEPTESVGMRRPSDPRFAHGLADARGRVGHPDGATGQRRSGGLSGEEEAICGQGESVDGDLPDRSADAGEGMGRAWPGPVNGFWRNADWLFCRGGTWRPVEPGTFPLSYGTPRGMVSLDPRLRGLAEVAGLDGASLKRAKAFRMGALKGYGNGIVAPLAQAFIEDCICALEEVEISISKGD